MISIFYNNKYSRVEKRIGVRIQKQPPKKKRNGQGETDFPQKQRHRQN